jgi:hypothetical protein
MEREPVPPVGSRAPRSAQQHRPNAADTWVAIAFQNTNGASGYANNQATQDAATRLST